MEGAVGHLGAVTQGSPEILGEAGHDRCQQQRRSPQGAVEDGQHRIQLGVVGRILGQLPGLSPDDVAVQGPEVGPQQVQRAVEVAGPGLLQIGREHRQQLIGQLLVVGVQHRRQGHHAGPVALDHAQGPGSQVPQPIGEVRIEAVDEALIGEAAVVAHLHVPHEVEAQGVVAEVQQGVRTDHVALALGHLVVAHEPPAVGQDGGGEEHAGGHEEGRPVDRMKAENILANQLEIWWPGVGRTCR